MKKIISLIMIAILTIFMVGCSSKNQTFYKNQLNIISDSNDVYVIALTNRDEISHYSMYKLKEYDEYEKLYDLPVSSNQAIENHHILWDNDKFYLIYYNIIGYNADTGEELYRAKDKIHLQMTMKFATPLLIWEEFMEKIISIFIIIIIV